MNYADVTIEEGIDLAAMSRWSLEEVEEYYLACVMESSAFWEAQEEHLQSVTLNKIARTWAQAIAPFFEEVR